jgi:hypothetical protein
MVVVKQRVNRGIARGVDDAFKDFNVIDTKL